LRSSADAEQIGGVQQQGLDEHPVLEKKLIDHACSMRSSVSIEDEL
jgi:hypothetical protein